MKTKLLLLFVSFSLCCFASEVHPDFKRDWQAFLELKKFNEQTIDPRVRQDREYLCLSEFSRHLMAQYRPYIPEIDRQEFFRPYHYNKIALHDGTEMSASWIRMPGNYHPFIATQAPLKDNVHLFWQMVAEKQIDQIIMLTELFEDPEDELCYCYWPQALQEPLLLKNGIEVKLMHEKELLTELKEKIQIRTFLLTYQGKEKKITHYWYRNWIDGTAPRQQVTISTLVDTVEQDKQLSDPQSPILVHCAAGIGRTGVFISVYHVTQRKKANDTKLNFFDFVAYLRWQRPFMVGGPDQYKFCHKVHQSLHNEP